MNLMDLLSSDSNTVPPEQDFNNLNNLSNYNEYTSFYGGDLQNIPEDVDPAKNPSTVYYLPTEMCSLQKDMSEAVIQMFTSTLSAELFPRRERSNINSLLSGPDDAVNGSHDTGPQSRAKIVSLIYNQLLTISMHPSLVVDHFISKGLLLSSTKARIRSFSGKLALFDKIIDLVSEKYEMETPSEDYNLMVIAKSIKELELIEGLVVGKKLRYQNVSSGKCLYEESRKTNRLDKDDLPDDEQTSEYKHRHHHFATRRAKQNKGFAKEFVLHLITSNHLCSSFTSDTQFDLMVSFDSELDVSSPGVELLRSPRKSDFNANATSQSRIPILIPIAVYSVEHLMKVIPKPESELGNLSTAREAEWRLRLLSVFISNRHNIFENQEEDLFSANYGKRLGVLEELLFSWDKSEPSSPYKWLDRYTKQVSTNTSGDKLKSRLYANNLSSLGHTFTNNTNGWDAASQGKFDEGSVNDYTSFKRQMARFLNARLDQVETLKANALTNIIPRLREQEAKRQEEIDHDEEQVGENYRKLRKLNEEVLVVDKRFNRVENDHHKLQESVAETQQMFDHLQELLLNKSDDEITKIMSEQETLLEQLEREKTVLTDESKGLTDEIEVAREEYQEKSTHAIQVAEKLSVLKDKQISLRKKVEGPGMSILPSLAKKDEISAYEMHLRRITQETGFLGDLFTSRLDKLVKERNLMVDTTTPTTGSRQNHRISRAATPL